MNKSNFYIIIFLSSIMVLLSCAKNEGQGEKFPSEELFTLEESELLKIPIDGRTPNTTSSLSYFVEDVEGDKNRYLVFLNRNRPSIQFYNLDDYNMDLIIELNEDGPNGVGRPSGVSVVGKDSIYIVSSVGYKISLINQQGTVKKSCRLLNQNQSRGEETGTPRVHTSRPLYFVDGMAYMNLAPDRNPHNDHFYEGFTNLKLNFEQCQFSYFNTFPESMQGNAWGNGSGNYSTTINNNNVFIYSFGPDEYLYSYNPKDHAKQKFYAGSKFIDKIEPMKTAWGNTVEYRRKYVLESPAYLNVIYDNYREVYYRFAIHEIEEKDEVLGFQNKYFDKPFSIIILNKDLKVIGEKLFPGKVYQINNFFLTEKGLFVSNGNDRNSNINEDELTFTLFELRPSKL